MWKKLIIATSTLLFGLLLAGTASASLYSFWTERGEQFVPCNQERKVIAAEMGMWGYDCTTEQNTELERRLRDFYSVKYNAEGERQLGYSVVTGYRSSLSLPMTASQTTVPVSSVVTKDGHTLTMSDLGSFVFLTIEPGGNKEEIVKCTGISGSTFTGCTRGLAFYGSSTVAVSANQKTHNASSQVVMSNVHYVYEQYVDINSKTQTIEGIKTFYTFPTVSSTGFTGLPTQNGEIATKYYVDNVGAGGFTAGNVSTTRGLSVDGSAPERVGINASSTSGGAFDASTGAYYQKIDTTTGLEYRSGSAGIGINTSTLVGLIATTTPTAGKLPIASSTTRLDDGWQNISYANATDLTDGNSTTVHYHNSAVVNFARSTNDGTGDQTVSHNLGATPRKTRISCAATQSNSWGTSTGYMEKATSTQYTVFVGADVSANVLNQGNTARMIYLELPNAVGESGALVSTTTPSTIILNWDINTAGGGTAFTTYCVGELEM